MDTAVLQLLALIKIRLRKEKGLVLNTQRFFAEQAYAWQVLDAAEECEDIELVTASLEIRDRLGWIAPARLTEHPPAERKTAAPEEKSRYMFGPRS
ncbi:MAG: hypothetical protein CGU28_11370 [Candidatus Dactylopiibacterium carminicum]|uniref:hypothetical protein n=1 Tax=Candidatus Dactylopiibacterium carminicum TaxID=857335 RepID=UPI000BA9F0C2|nr:hypothetical protein [Candidatus Dactylopiibacterium carminicum]PAS95813.1 MAG: hypothetical protein CGU28_11370 [Candidatus Dactylopiibacterium carminicum]